MKYRVPRRSFIPKLTDGFIENFYALFKTNNIFLLKELVEIFTKEYYFKILGTVF